MATPSVLDFRLNTAAPDYLVKSYAGNLVRYAPNGQAPIFAFTAIMQSGMCASVEHGYMSKTMLFPQTTTTATALAAGTSLTVVDTSDFLVGDLILNWNTGEMLRVTAISDATTLGVARGYNTGDAGIAVGSGDKLYAVGNAFEQGSYRPAARALAISRVMNNTQIFRNSWALAHSLAVIQTIVGKGNIAENKQDCGMFHASDIEKAILWGQKSSKVVNGQLLTTMNGIWNTLREQVPANVMSAGATTTYTQLETMLDKCFNTITDGRNGNERALYVGGTARSVINKIGRLSGIYHIVDGATNYGLQFSTFKTARGTFRMVEHPILNSNLDWAKCAFAIDLPSLKLLYLNGRKTMNQEYGTTGTPVDNGIDAVGGTLTTECTMEITNPSANVVITGLTAAAAEPVLTILDDTP